jgi:DNA-directed RNA polymerase subunit RPC12/RpoP
MNGNPWDDVIIWYKGTQYITKYRDQKVEQTEDGVIVTVIMDLYEPKMGDGKVCPYCESKNIHPIEIDAGEIREYHCSDCKKNHYGKNKL